MQNYQRGTVFSLTFPAGRKKVQVKGSLPPDLYEVFWNNTSKNKSKAIHFTFFKARKFSFRILVDVGTIGLSVLLKRSYSKSKSG